MRCTPDSAKAMSVASTESRKADGARDDLDNEALEVERDAVDGGVADAEVIRQAAEEETLDAMLAQVAGEACGRGVVVLKEGRVGVDLLAAALAHDQLRVGDVERGVEVGAGGVLHAVNGPEGLPAVGNLDGLEGLGARVGAGKGDVAARVPVLGEDNVGELAREGADGRDDLVTAGNGESAADSIMGGAEVVLEVDDEQCVGGEKVPGP